jgi:hypothetical protein
MSVEIETSSTPFARKARLGLSALACALAVHASARADERSAAAFDGGFVANHGQFAQGVSFAARAHGYGVALEPSGVRISVAAGTASVRMRVLGSQDVVARGLSQLPFFVNFLLGSPADWRRDVEVFDRVSYRNILPGVDWVFHGEPQGRLEHDFVVAPGASPHAIRLLFEGEHGHTLTAQGSLRVELANGDVLEQPAPVAYQRDAAGRRELVAVRFEERADGALGFAVGKYDPARALTIDPTLLYATYFGGSGFEDARAVATDSAGSVYLAGSTSLGLFPIRNALQPAYGGGSTDVFVCKLTADGSALAYATFLGGSDADAATGIAVDPSGAVYLVGSTLSSDFPTVSASQAARAGATDGFFARIDAGGNALSYSSYLGGEADDFPSAVAVDTLGAARIVGSTFSTSFPTLAPLQPALGGQGDAFVSFVSPSGVVSFSSYLGGNGNDTGTGIALGPAGAVHLVGATSGDFPVAGAFQASFAGGGFDAFVASFTSSGSLTRSSYLGGSGRDEAAAVAVAPSGAIVVTGYSMSADFPGVASGFQPVRGGGADAFISEVGAQGDGIAFSSYLGGSGNDRAQGVAVDGAGVIRLVGFTDSSNFPKLDSPQLALSGGSDAFVAQISSRQLAYSALVGGTGTDKAVGVAVEGATKTFAVVGNTTSANFPTQGALYPARIGSQDAFVMRFSSQAPKPSPWGGWSACATLLAVLSFVIFNRSRKEHVTHISGV